MLNLENPPLASEPGGADIENPPLESGPGSVDVENPPLASEPGGADIENPSLESGPGSVDVENPSPASEPGGADIENPSLESGPGSVDVENPSPASEPGGVEVPGAAGDSMEAVYELLLLAKEGAVPSRRTLAVELIAQGTRMWCWAGSGQMIMKYMGHDVSQCRQANHRFSRTDCCTSPQNCVFGGWPQFEHWGFACNTLEGALTFAQIKAEIDANRPIAFSWGWPGGGGHMMVIIGYNEETQMLLINDPWPPNTGDQRWITYSFYVSSTGHHVHWRDYYFIRYVGALSASESTATEEPMAQYATSQASDGFSDASTAATEALKLFPELVTPDNAHAMGLDAVGFDASALSLGESFPVYYIRRDSLLQDEVGEDVSELLVDGEELFYPVITDDQVTSAVTVSLENDQWDYTSLGDASLSKALEEVRSRLVSDADTEESEYFIVRVPTMYLIFVAHKNSAGKLMFTHVYESDEFDFRKHETDTAEKILNAILPKVPRAEPGTPPVLPF